uniref:Hydantoinase A/oxoprolinase domain-containing protein n=1 Tax=Glossina brevipalpis TaxID=37001 RepID=A0A1A9W3J0_9MUSC
MGGTSTDVSRYAGIYEHVVESTATGVTIQAPQLDINTVAAGGDSRLFFRSGLIIVGPESAHPGPACYRKGGPLTVTYANLILGQSTSEQMSVTKVALGLIRVANEAMCRPIRALTQVRGLYTSKHVLLCFGGAVSQHACAIARDLGISKFLIEICLTSTFTSPHCCHYTILHYKDNGGHN